jgi:hypothetical protein
MGSNQNTKDTECRKSKIQLRNKVGDGEEEVKGNLQDDIKSRFQDKHCALDRRVHRETREVRKF